MMVVGIPVMDSHDWTQRTVAHLAKTVRDPDQFQLVIMDNASEEPYTSAEFGDLPFRISTWRWLSNQGYYLPLKLLYDLTFDLQMQVGEVDLLLGLMHNDLMIYEEGWNARMTECFRADRTLGLVGLCGSYECDSNGGRGAGTMCYFRGRDPVTGVVTGQPQEAGERITDLRPSVVLDSLFMMFRAGVIPTLETKVTWNDLPLAHFYDRIWPLRLIERGWRIGTLGVECDHWGGITLVANGRFNAQDCRRWCEERGLVPSEPGNWQLAMYLEAERRLLREFRDEKGMIPCAVRRDWNVETHRGPFVIRRP